jgi:hypothetical protein
VTWQIRDIGSNVLQSLNKMPTQVSKSEPGEHPLPNTKVVEVFLLLLDG